jgi:hypothetical protein
MALAHTRDSTRGTVFFKSAPHDGKLVSYCSPESFHEHKIRAESIRILQQRAKSGTKKGTSSQATEMNAGTGQHA